MGAYRSSTPRRGIVAASVRLHQPGTKLTPTTEWQADAWTAYDITGQGRYVANAVANAISRCRLYIAKIDKETGEIEGPADDPRLRPFVASPLGTGPRRRENLRLAALNLFVAGEYYLVGEAANPADPKARDLWYIVSGFDFDRRGSGRTFKCTRPATAGGGQAELVPSRDVICRVWTPHPKHAGEADSPFRAALPDLSILATVRKREAAELDSRLTGAGIMLWPQSVDFGEKGIEGFTDKLVDAASQIIDDPAHPNSLIPEMVTMKKEDIEAVRLINFWSDLSGSLADLTERKVLSLAQSLDAPVNMALGTQGESNHWSAWLVSEDTITTHYDPILSRNADALTNVYLRPGIERLGGGLDPDEYAYAFDTAPLRIRGDRLGDDMQLHDRELVSDEVLLTSAGRTEEDMPSNDEARARYVRKLVLANPDLIREPMVVAMLGWGDAPVVIDAAPADAVPAPRAPEAGDRTGTPAIPDQAGANPPAAADRPAITASAGNLGAIANLAVLRALELAGGRLAKRNSADDDRAQLHTTLPRVPEDNQITKAMRGAWRHLPTALATVDNVDPEHIERVLDRYTVDLIKRRAPHNPTALAAVFELLGVGA